MNRTIALLFFIIPLLAIKQLNAQEKETFKKHGFTLNFTSLDKDFDPALKARMVETFFIIYPKLVKEYNKQADKEVNFVIDTAYKGVAATGGGRIVYSPAYFKNNPGDIDVVTHEAMHVVQAYKGRSGPGWLTEGIADYVRYKFGVDNKGAGWTLPEYKTNQSYTNSYRITARFLAWLESNGHKGIVKKLDNSMRSHTYTKDIWQKETGKTLDDLWKAYSENPTI
ncbi:basic secretory protein-like protein [Pedobacter frigoris]|uniref:Secretory protein n=1 Tax=Pedobacter frigoris TaxID=2571272 RepID=A0A4U1CCS8_9SPHI|nr:basic secretory protein-like protein [Pedobacter frigoris]TKC03980.1 secretory protein [Pedobacter frigoris]